MAASDIQRNGYHIRMNSTPGIQYERQDLASSKPVTRKDITDRLVERRVFSTREL